MMRVVMMLRSTPRDRNVCYVLLTITVELIHVF